ncbi:MAG TPA: isoprenylcysteine carboxylmethyltransferase family protein [Chitinophagaceae bacterium]
MVTSHVILAIVWILYCILHSVFASSKFKQAASQWMGKQFKFYRLYYIIFAVLGLIAIIIYPITFSSYQFFAVTKTTTITGILVTTIGLTIMSISILKYFMQVSGLKELIEEKTGDESGNELMITGIHKFVRHPLYTGTFIFVWGLLIIFPYASVLIIDVIITVYTLIGLQFEERKLEREFGAAYKLYKKKVPMLIPRLVK